MGEQFFDDLAKGLDNGTISRGRALKLAGGALLGAAVPSLFPREAEARRRCNARCRCRRKGGTRMPADPASPCRCATPCESTNAIPCHNNEDCRCLPTIEGEGFCGLGSVASTCTSSADCAEFGANWRCIPCEDVPGGHVCAEPCPT